MLSAWTRNAFNFSSAFDLMSAISGLYAGIEKSGADEVAASVQAETIHAIVQSANVLSLSRPRAFTCRPL